MSAGGVDCDVRALVPVRLGGVLVGVRDTLTGAVFVDRCEECGGWLDADALTGGHDCEGVTA